MPSNSSDDEIRCDSGVMFGLLREGILEVKCRHPGCGVERGVVVIHRFSLPEGTLLETALYKDPIAPTSKGR